MLTGRRPCVEREKQDCADECRSRLSCSFEQRRRREEKCVHRPRFPTAHRVVCSLDAQFESRLFVASAIRISASRFAKHFRQATDGAHLTRIPTLAAFPRGCNQEVPGLLSANG